MPHFLSQDAISPAWDQDAWLIARLQFGCIDGEYAQCMVDEMECQLPI